MEILKKANSNVPIYVYRGESEDELINKLDELARGVEYLIVWVLWNQH